MRLCVVDPFSVRGRVYGGPKPLFCVPLVAARTTQLAAQAEAAHQQEPDLIEWRADSHKEQTPSGLVGAAEQLRRAVEDDPIIFALRAKAEGGAQEMRQSERRTCIEAVLSSRLVDIVDLELSNETEFLEPLMRIAREHGIRVILSAHDFQATPANEGMLATIAAMQSRGADVAKIAVMPRTAEDVLRLLQVTLESRRQFPGLPLATMSMGALGGITRIAGFLYGSDMAYAVVQESSAPGQIPLKDARILTETLLRYS